MADPSPLGSLFLGVAGASSALLLSVTAAVYSVAHSSGARYGLTFRSLLGRPGVAFLAWTILALSSGLIWAAVGARPDLRSFASVRLPFADAADRPETAIALATALGVSIALAFAVLARVIKLTAPATVGRQAVRSARASDFHDALFARWGIPEPPGLDRVGYDLIVSRWKPGAENESIQAPSAADIATETERRKQLWRVYELERTRLSTRLQKGTIRNPLSPAINALHVLIDQRALEPYQATWEGLVSTVLEWRKGEQRSDERCTEWLWGEMEELARHALSSSFASAARLTVNAMAESLRESLSIGGRQARNMSSVAMIAVSKGDGELVEAIVRQYSDAAEQGIASGDVKMFEYACLGLGHLGEITMGLPRTPSSVIANNQAGSFANLIDVGQICADELHEASYRFRDSDIENYPLFLADALAVVLEAAIDAGPTRGDGVLKCLYGMGEIVSHAVKISSHEQLSFSAGLLRSAAQEIAQGNLGEKTRRDAWESLAWHSIDGMAACGEQHREGLFDPCHSFAGVVKAIPPESRGVVGEVASRSHLGRGVEVLRDIRGRLERELGTLDGWYV